MLMQATLIKPGWSKKKKTKQNNMGIGEEMSGKGFNRKGMRGGNRNLR